MKIDNQIQLSTFILMGVIYSCHGKFTTAYICLGIALSMLIGIYGYKLYKYFKK